MDVSGQKNQMKKYFLAVVVPDPAGEEIEEMKLDLLNRFGLKGALRSPAHITLHRPFEFKKEKEDHLKSVLSEFTFKDQFEITLKNFNFFPPRVVYIDVSSHPHLDQLYRCLLSHVKINLGLFNESDDTRGFHPHVTIAFRDLKKTLFPALQKEFELKKYTFKFPFRGVSLLRLEKKWDVIHTFSIPTATDAF
jgi:2'-5' RNA ligase